MSVRLRELELVDLYIAKDHREYRNRAGANAPRLPVPDGYTLELDVVREKCAALFKEYGRYEFALPHDGALYRVAVMDDVTWEPIFVLNRAPDELPALGMLGIPASVIATIRDPDARGMIVISGDQRQGKTTSASVMTIHRLETVGGLALALQDPIESNIAGTHGSGRLYLQPVKGVSGYSEAAQRAMRFGMTTILYGEIRRGDQPGSVSNAAAAFDLAESGCLILTTTHANSILDTITRLVDLVADGMADTAAARASVAKSLRAVIWQRLEHVRLPNGAPAGTRVVTHTLDLSDPTDKQAIANAIAEGAFKNLPGLIDRQARRHLATDHLALRGF